MHINGYFLNICRGHTVQSVLIDIWVDSGFFAVRDSVVRTFL